MSRISMDFASFAAGSTMHVVCRQVIFDHAQVSHLFEKVTDGSKFHYNGFLDLGSATYTASTGSLTMRFPMPLNLDDANAVVLPRAMPSWDSLCSLVDVCPGLGGLAQGVLAAGRYIAGAHDRYLQLKDLSCLYSDAPTVSGAFGDVGILHGIWQTVQGARTISSVVSCQPFSLLGDGRNSADDRAGCLPQPRAATCCHTAWTWWAQQMPALTTLGTDPFQQLCGHLEQKSQTISSLFEQQMTLVRTLLSKRLREDGMEERCCFGLVGLTLGDRLPSPLAASLPMILGLTLVCLFWEVAVCHTTSLGCLHPLVVPRFALLMPMCRVGVALYHGSAAFAIGTFHLPGLKGKAPFVVSHFALGVLWAVADMLLCDTSMRAFRVCLHIVLGPHRSCTFGFLVPSLHIDRWLSSLFGTWCRQSRALVAVTFAAWDVSFPQVPITAVS